jgi:hypothetical protein
MTILSEILKYILPATIMLLAVYLIIHRFLKHEVSKFENERHQAMQKEIFPVRLQAYERIILLLERISPNHLILRMNQPGMNALQFQGLLVQTIRDEFDHNLSQQLYISSASWELVRTAREELIRLINTASGNLGNNAQAHDLASRLLELHASLEHDPVARAIEAVKEEARMFF